MSDLTSAWHAEHAQFAKLLNLLDAQVNAFHEGETPDYELMHDVVFYLKHYADRFHHPREDVAFQRLIAHDASMGPKVARLLQEHRVIDAHGSELLERLAQATADSVAVVPRGALESAAATYLVYYRHHLSSEEKEILPRAQRLLTDEDWEAVKNAVVGDGPDPLFGAHPIERFKELRRQLVRGAS